MKRSRVEAPHDELRAREVLSELIESREKAMRDVEELRVNGWAWYRHAKKLEARVQDLETVLGRLVSVAETARELGVNTIGGDLDAKATLRCGEAQVARKTEEEPTVEKYDRASDPRCAQASPLRANPMPEHISKANLSSKVVEVHGFDPSQPFAYFVNLRCYGINYIGQGQHRNYYVSFFTPDEACVACRRLDGCKMKNGDLLRAIMTADKEDLMDSVEWKKLERGEAVSRKRAEELLTLDGKDPSKVDEYFFTSLRLHGSRFLPQSKREIRDILISYGVRNVGHIAVPHGRDGTSLGKAYVHVLCADALRLFRLGELDLPRSPGEKVRVTCTIDTDLGPRE